PGSGTFFAGAARKRPSEGDEPVACFVRHLLGSRETPAQADIEVELTRASAVNFRTLAQRVFNRLECSPRIAAGPVDQTGREPFRIVEQDPAKLVGGELVAPA